ncbi:MAG: hypothetical protein HQ495_15545 [Alphaproteobacteria bacterium]|nr:hypothetical protein [Alphaproteobacteria bacterium]
MTELIGTVFYRIGFGNPILINIGFQSIAFIGIVAFLSALNGRAKLFALVILLMPSFSLWSSVASKEAIVVFAVGLIAQQVVRQYRQSKISWPLLGLGLAITFVFKNHYLAAVIFLIVGTWMASRVRQVHFLGLVGLMVPIIPLYLLRDRIAELAFGILPHFLETGFLRGRLTREAFWLDPSDVFTKAPEGMFISFFGPTVQEAGIGALQMAAFTESAVLLVLLAAILVMRLPTAPLFSIFVGVGTLLLILFANYPFGVMNSGSAIRYRTGYEILILVVVIVVLAKPTFVEWRKVATRHVTRVAIPAEP